jgi:protein gp37
MQRSSIEWTDWTSNPIKFRNAAGDVVWGCVHASPGCQHCYAETLAKRYGKGGPFNVPTMAVLTPFLDDAELRTLWRSPKLTGQRVFLGDMTDIFGEWVSDVLLDQLVTLFANRSDVTWQILTKRATRARDYFVKTAKESPTIWPLKNVWLGVSCEDQQRFNDRARELIRTPACVRFISAEPLLESILMDNGETSLLSCRSTLTDEQFDAMTPEDQDTAHCCESFDDDLGHFRGIDWVIVGGESGSKARDCDVAWIRSIVRQCTAATVPVFVKQMGSSHFQRCPQCGRHVGKCLGGMVDECSPAHHQLARETFCRNAKGSDPSEWSEDLRVRQFPEAVD